MIEFKPLLNFLVHDSYFGLEAFGFQTEFLRPLPDVICLAFL